MCSVEERLHPFEEAGLGLAPFRFAGMSVNVYSAAPGHSQPGGCCAYCYQGIKYECCIVSSDGKRFTVGMDCVERLGSKHNKLISDAKRAKLQLDAQKREEIRKAKYEAACKRYAEKLQAERDRNGGLTDSEVAEAKAKAEREAKAAEFIAKNDWIIQVLKREYQSEFIRSMIEKVSGGPIDGLSGRCVSILRDIYSKSFGRRGSKKYEAAADVFDSRLKG